MLDFAITGLGRCRTAWFAAFLSDGYSHCRHEFAHQCARPADFDKARVPGKVSGVADTMVWLCDRVPAKRVLVIHRDPVVAAAFSLQQYGVRQDLRPHAERLRQVEGIHVEYDELDERMAEIVWLLTDREMDADRYALFAPLNIQVNDPASALREYPDYWRKQLCRQ